MKTAEQIFLELQSHEQTYYHTVGVIDSADELKQAKIDTIHRALAEAYNTGVKKGNELTLIGNRLLDIEPKS